MTVKHGKTIEPVLAHGTSQWSFYLPQQTNWPLTFTTHNWYCSHPNKLIDFSHSQLVTGTVAMILKRILMLG